MTDETTTSDPVPDGDEFPPLTFQPLRATIEADGSVGGEFQALYGVHGVEGQTLTVRLNWSGNKADFSVDYDYGPEGNPGEPFDLGPLEETADGSSQSGKLPKTGLYIIGITGEVGDAADYRLRVTLK
jgi:hypothetical protein